MTECKIYISQKKIKSYMVASLLRIVYRLHFCMGTPYKFGFCICIYGRMQEKISNLHFLEKNRILYGCVTETASIWYSHISVAP